MSAHDFHVAKGSAVEVAVRAMPGCVIRLGRQRAAGFGPEPVEIVFKEADQIRALRDALTTHLAVCGADDDGAAALLTAMRGRYSVSCIPGREEDGSDAYWFVFDRVLKRTANGPDGGVGENGREVATRRARHMNEVLAKSSCGGPR